MNLKEEEKFRQQMRWWLTVSEVIQKLTEDEQKFFRAWVVSDNLAATGRRLKQIDPDGKWSPQKLRECDRRIDFIYESLFRTTEDKAAE